MRSHAANRPIGYYTPGRISCAKCHEQSARANGPATPIYYREIAHDARDASECGECATRLLDTCQAQADAKRARANSGSQRP